MTDSGTRTTRQLVLGPHPASASAARRWVRDQLHRIGHEELAEAAELATSELVTNAVLHAQTTVTVELRPLNDHCRIAVHDLSPGRVTVMAQAAGQVWSSGRGLQILASIASRWGVEEEPPGKQVWFEPRSVSDAVRVPSEPEACSGTSRPPARHAVLHEAPLVLLRQAQQRLADLHREMLLIVFMQGEPDGTTPAAGRPDVPSRLVELAQAIEPITTDLLPHGPEPVADDRATLSCRLPDALRDTDLATWPDLLDEADDYCRSEQLLTLAAPRHEAAARRWLLTELHRQSSGLAPTSWPDYLAGA